MNIDRNSISKKVLIPFIIFMFSGLFLLSCTETEEPAIDGDKIREYANALYNRELYPQAIAEYQRYLDFYPIDEVQQANINFIMGNIYFERMNDYENALAHYLKVKHVYPDAEIQSQIDKQIIACLERLQRSADAKQALDEATSLEPEKIEKPKPGTILAKIGDREISSGDLQHRLNQLPDYIKDQFKTRDSKLEFLRQIVANELFYDAAKRKGLESDHDVIEGAFQAKKGLMVEKYLQEEIASQIQIQREDLDLYYKANKEKYVEKDDKGNVKRQKSLDEVRQQVAEDLLGEKQQAAYQDLLRRMMTAEKVEIYDDLVK